MGAFVATGGVAEVRPPAKPFNSQYMKDAYTIDILGINNPP